MGVGRFDQCLSVELMELEAIYKEKLEGTYINKKNSWVGKYYVN